MHSMISKYAIEGRDQSGKPDGKFYLDETLARQASEEVVGTHLKLSGDKLKQYMDANFWDTWTYYDTAGDGKIEADRMGTFMRYLTHDANLNIQ